jgi:hypothetical protein
MRRCLIRKARENRVLRHVPTLQGDHAVNEYMFKSVDIAVAYLRYEEFDRKTFKPLE